MKIAVLMTALGVATVAGAATNADVGDGDSFGRPVNFLGMAQTAGVQISPDCTGFTPATCKLITDPAAMTTITNIGTEAVIKLPANVAHSLLCFTLTPLGGASLNNSTTTRHRATAFQVATWRIESDVLNNPALINAQTGLPFGGFISGNQTLSQASGTVDPGEDEEVDPTGSRSCISGQLSLRGLAFMGLTDAQARALFRGAITVRFGSSATAQFAFVTSKYGVRIYGD